MIPWLPSENRWIDEIAERVLMGEIIVVRAVRKWGMSEFAKTLCHRLGDSAVLVRGLEFTESSQKDLRAKIAEDLERTVEKHRCAQLIFDDYGDALRRTQGGTLHSMLYGRLVDSDRAADIGAVLIAKFSDTIDLEFSGSPLVSRADVVALPILDEADSVEVGFDYSTIRARVGDGTWLARNFNGVNNLSEGDLRTVEKTNFSAEKIVHSLPYSAVEVLAGARSYADTDALGKESLKLFGYVSDFGAFETGSLVSQSQVLDLIHAQSPGWPSSFDSSVDKFVDLISGASDCIWVDRYLFSDPDRARRFLDRVRLQSSARLRILVSRDFKHGGQETDISSALQGLDDVVVKFMNRSDRHMLHDRHLIIPSMMKGFNLPTARVIFGLDAPGSAVVSKLPAFAINYSEFWRRADPVFPK